MIRLIAVAVLLSASLALEAHAASKRWLVAFEPGTSTSDRMRAVNAAGFAPVEDLAELGIVSAAPKFGVMSPRVGDLKGGHRIAAVEEDVYEVWIDAQGRPAPVIDLPASFQQMALPSLTEFLNVLPKAAPKLEVPAAAIPGDNEVPWGIARLNLPEAAANGLGDGSGVKVAIIDTGIDSSHPELAHAVVGGYNATSGGKDKWQDDNGHGTHVSGTVAALRDGKGVVGVAPGVKLYAVKVLDANGGGFLTDILKGIVWTGNNGIQVANMSLGSERGVIFMKYAVQYANMRGVTLVAAAGNSGGSVGYPASYEETIAVSALEKGDRIAEFSSRGKEVDFIAPGVDVLSTLPGGKYQKHSGTSMATPHVTGLAALAVSKGARTPAQVRAALKGAASSLPGLSKAEQGDGLVDARKLR